MVYNRKYGHGGDIYTGEVHLDFSANVNPLGSSPKVKAAITKALDQLSFYPDPYCRELVEAISEYEGVLRENILCGNGAAELIYSYAKALKPPKAMILAPTFSEYEESLDSYTQVVYYRLKEEDDFTLGEGILTAIKEENPSVLYLCNPNNPTGCLIERDLLVNILRQCEHINCHVFLDESFMDLVDESQEMKGYLNQFQHLFILKALTKSHGLAGLRVGYGLSADRKLLAAMSKEVPPWNVSSLAQVGGVAALIDKEHLFNFRKLLKKERPYLKQGLERVAHRVIDSESNYLLFKSEPSLGKALLEQGIKLRDCSNYPRLNEGWYRCAIRTREENRHLLEAMEELIHGETAYDTRNDE